MVYEKGKIPLLKRELVTWGTLHPHRATSSGTPIEPEATSGIWSAFGRRLQAQVYAVLYVIKDAMMASYYGTASPVHVSSLFKLARGSPPHFPSSYLLHPSESWFRPLFLVFPELVRICFKPVSRQIFNLRLASG